MAVPGIGIQARSLSDACASGGPGNGDGVLDPGESVAIGIVALSTYPATATGVTGTLTSLTPGVTVTTGTASFGDLAPGGSAAGDHPFAVALSPSLACGASLDFTLAFSSSQGTSSQGFSLLVGQTVGGTAATVLAESFESWPPPGWALFADPQTGGVWDSSSHAAGCVSGASYPYSNNTGGSGSYADANSDCFGDGMDTMMVTPSFSLASSSYVSAQLQFKSDFLCAGNLDDAWVDITTDGGAIWTNLVYFDHQSERGPGTQTVDLTPYLGQGDIRLNFEYEAPGWDWYWQVDDVSVTAIQPGGCLANVCSASACTLACAATAPSAAAAGTPVPFSATATPSAGCAGTPAFSWSFGDGQTSGEQNPTHAYGSAGTYSWSVSVTLNGATCSQGGSITVHPAAQPPLVTQIKKVSPPFSLLVTGSNLQSGIRVLVNGAPWDGVRWKRPTKIKVTGGASLKAALPKGVTAALTFINPDGGQTTTTWSW